VSSAALGPRESLAASPAATQGGSIAGVVSHEKTQERLANALVLLQCSSFEGTRETQTTAQGLYAFTGIPTGTCTVQVLSGHANVSKVVEVSGSGKLRTNFKIDPSDEIRREIRVSPMSTSRSAVGRSVSMDEFRNIPVGPRGRTFTQTVELPNTEEYAHIESNAFRSPIDHPRSTFSADVDTASYANVRRFIEDRALPPADAVRVEELINYFDYDYVVPSDERPVTVNWEIAGCPWDEHHRLARIGLQTKPIEAEDVPRRNLVFLIDVSGSMDAPDKLPLLQRALDMLVTNLRPQDTVSIVLYAGAAGVALSPTDGAERETIRQAIAELEPGGSTNGAAGIRLAYDLARESFAKRGINRVILATDGDFNVGTSSEGELVRLIEEERKSGVFLSVLGFGTGNLQDAKMEQLADKGNGNYAYIDSIGEARKVLVEEAGATLVTVAKDVKLQVEFNPAKVAEYKLIGYENRLLADEDFDDDTKDAGEMGAGHSVTALYELVPARRKAKRSTAPLRYQVARTTTSAARRDEWMSVAVRYKRPSHDRSRKLEVRMKGTPKPFATASEDLRFAAAVATFGMGLRTSKRKARKETLALAHTLAQQAIGQDVNGERRAFVEMVGRARALALLR
jgi:Ca-activated chloride channel family protein